MSELEQLRQENQLLRQRNRDLEIALSTVSDHGDAVETQLYEANLRLKSEVAERLKAESALQTLIRLISNQKSDLEIILETLIEHGDVVDTQWHQKLCEMTLRADLDGLTQIPNRRRFNEYLEQQWKQMARDQQFLSLVICDIDYFKAYNDTYGHVAGDDCIRRVAESLSQSLQRPSDLAARYGGEEFVVLLPRTDLEGAIAVAQRIQSAIANLNIHHRSSPVQSYVTVSIGVASTLPTPHALISRLLTVADQHLYLAKKRGRNQIISSSGV